VAAEISANHPTETPLMVGILTGSFVFLADLVRELTIPVEIDFIRARSYGSGTESTGAVEITKDIEHDVTGRIVIIVEDILDTGLTLRFVSDRIRAGNPGTIETCALLVREGATPSDYMGLWIPQGFVVGYGIDNPGFAIPLIPRAHTGVSGVVSPGFAIPLIPRAHTGAYGVYNPGFAPGHGCRGSESPPARRVARA